MTKIEEAEKFLTENFPQGYILVVAPPQKGSTCYMVTQRNVADHAPFIMIGALLQTFFNKHGGGNVN